MVTTLAVAKPDPLTLEKILTSIPVPIAGLSAAADAFGLVMPGPGERGQKAYIEACKEKGVIPFSEVDLHYDEKAGIVRSFDKDSMVRILWDEEFGPFNEGAQRNPALMNTITRTIFEGRKVRAIEIEGDGTGLDAFVTKLKAAGYVATENPQRFEYAGHEKNVITGKIVFEKAERVGWIPKEAGSRDEPTIATLYWGDELSAGFHFRPKALRDAVIDSILAGIKPSSFEAYFAYADDLVHQYNAFFPLAKAGYEAFKALFPAGSMNEKGYVLREFSAFINLIPPISKEPLYVNDLETEMRFFHMQGLQIHIGPLIARKHASELEAWFKKMTEGLPEGKELLPIQVSDAEKLGRGFFARFNEHSSASWGNANRHLTRSPVYVIGIGSKEVYVVDTEFYTQSLGIPERAAAKVKQNFVDDMVRTFPGVSPDEAVIKMDMSERFREPVSIHGYSNLSGQNIGSGGYMSGKLKVTEAAKFLIDAFEGNADMFSRIVKKPRVIINTAGSFYDPVFEYLAMEHGYMIHRATVNADLMRLL